MNLAADTRSNPIGRRQAGEDGGLRGLADRVEALGGSLEVASPLGAGTTLRAEIPRAACP